MNAFLTNKIFQPADLLTDKLQTARTGAGLSIEQAAKKLKIKPQYLKALEAGDFKKLPDGVYAKRYLAEYAEFLGLNKQETVSLYDKLTEQPMEKQQKLFAKQVIKRFYFWTMPKFIKNVLIGLLALVCFFYLGFRLEKIIAPPSLKIFTPTDNLVTQEKELEVRGRAELETEISINGEKILSDNDGLFSKNITLKNGINTITISAKKKYGRYTNVTRQVFVK